MHGPSVPTLERAPRPRPSGTRPVVGLAALLLGITLIHGSTAHAISHRTLFTPTGAAVNDRMGNSVSDAGDMNGDGYGDVIVAAAGSDAGGPSGDNRGRAYVYFGGPAADAVADLVLTGEATGDQFGTTVAGAGDMNGDGYADVIVGAFANDAGGPPTDNRGRAYVFFGGAVPNATADLVFTGLVAGDWLGVWVDGAGDVNGDGYDDVIVGAQRNDTVFPNAGQAYIFYGGATPNSGADVTLNGEAQDDEFGYPVVGAGDVNGDGYFDVFVGAALSNSNGADAGRAYLFHGGPAPDAAADLTLSGEAAGDLFGSALAGADVNADGYSDLIVGAPSALAEAGRVYIYPGGPGAAALSPLVLDGEAASDQFGAAVGPAGDLNGDGHADFVVGAYLNNAGGADAGRAYAYFGGPEVGGAAGLILTGEAAGDGFGASVWGAGDVDGDGFGDLVVGAWTNNAGGSDAGRAYITAVYPYQIVIPAGGDRWVAGAPVAVVWRGHEVADLELSLDGGLSYTMIRSGIGGSAINIYRFLCPETTTTACRVRIRKNGVDPWHAYVDQTPKLQIWRHRRPIVPSIEALLTLPAVLAADTVGAVSRGDVNGDGRPDIICGMSGSNSGAGRADVYLGAAGRADGAPNWLSPPITLVQGVAGDAFGSAVAVGDMNGDCIDDIAIGAPGSDIGSPEAGRAYVYLGGATPHTTPDLAVGGTASGDRLGLSLALVSDMNGDGYADLACGAPFSSINGSGSGKVQVYYGGVTLDGAIDLTLAGEAAGDNFGSVLMPLPDGEGQDLCERFPELCPVLSGMLAVGAPMNDTGGLNSGAAYLFSGGTSVDAVPDRVLRGSQADAHFGASMASIGDFNGDGLSDLAIGAPDEDGFCPPGACPDVGRVRVWAIDPRCFVIDPCPDGPGPWFDAQGEAAGDRFGLALASTDYDHNGLSDLVVAAPLNDATGNEAGRVYIYDGRIAPESGPGPGSAHGVIPDFVVGDATAGAQFGRVLAVTEALKVQPQPEPPSPPTSDLRRSRCRRTSPLSAGAAAARGVSLHEPEPDPYVRAPMLGGDLIVGRRGSNPNLRVYDVNRYHLRSPAGTATWNVGSLQSISWSGAEPVAIQLSVDGGASYSTIATSPGGQRVNSMSLRVPHLPTRFGSLRLIPWPPCPSPFGLTCPPPWGFAQSETLLTIQSSVSLLNLVAKPVDLGTELTWSTDPGVGPEGLAGYRLYRLGSASGDEGTRIGPELIVESRYIDRDRIGDSYRLTSINGLGEELELGRVEPEPGITGLKTWPSPISTRGTMTVAFAAPMAAPGVPASDLDVGAFDVGGRRIATLASGYVPPRAGTVRIEWRLTGSNGDAVRPGLYFIRASAPSARLRIEHKVVVMP